MNRVIVVALGLALCSVPVLAGEFLMNEEVAYGLRVTFSEPVTLSYFGDVLTVVSPQGEASAFTFSGAELPPWVGHGLAWTPATARILSHEWLAVPPSVEIPEGGLTRESLWNLGRSPTHEEIMAAIAEYPGPDEPLYEPAPDEAIWLTDLERHADVYDNDSIKINYADWFDKSQITKIEVYRNGVKMRFLPDQLEVLTNEQMKTFDGNPLEHSPESEHTDHAVFGYTYEFRFQGDDGQRIAAIEKRLKSSIHLETSHAFVNVNHIWWKALRKESDEEILRRLVLISREGFDGIQVDVNLYMRGSHETEVIPFYEHVPGLLPDWRITAQDDEISKILRLAAQADLDTELRLGVWITDDYKRAHPGEVVSRSALTPGDVSQWFENYTVVCRHYAQLAESERAKYFCPMVELSSMEQHTERVAGLLSNLSTVFSGTLIVSEPVHHFINGWCPPYSDGTLLGSYGRFWDHPVVEIGIETWDAPLESNSDARLSVMVQNYVEFIGGAVGHYRSEFPSKLLIVDEMGVFDFDGQAIGRQPRNELDHQETTDIWAAYLVALAYLDVDGLCIWNYDLFHNIEFVGLTDVTKSGAIRCITAILGAEWQ